MKALLKAPAAFIFAVLSRAIVGKYKPTIVMVTGSVGKTSTKDACAAALSERFHLRASEKSYNSEFGVPLTIIGAKNPWNNPEAWVKVLFEALALILFPSHYPKLLVLEVGADSPGDLAHILRIATPDAVVVTKLPDVPVHVEAYASPAAVREEEFAPALALPRGAPLIISADDPYALELATRVPAMISTYGYGSTAHVRLAAPYACAEDGFLSGMCAHLLVGKEKRDLVVRGALGRPQLYAVAAAIALSRALGLTLDEALSGLASYVPPAGRARVLRGKNGSTIIDDTYNSSPTAVEEVLEALALVTEAKRHIVILGDMLELGRFSKEQHQHIGTLAGVASDMVIGVGERASTVVLAAASAGKGSVETARFDTSRQAAEALKDLPREGDLILIKGSQGVRMERVVEALIAEDVDTGLLVRQEAEWKKR